MHETLKKRLIPVLLLAALVMLLSVTGGCLKQSEVKWVDGEYTNPADVVTIEEVKAPEPPPAPAPPPPAPKPVPVPKPEPKAQYTPKPVPPPEPTKIVLEEPGSRIDRRSYLIPTPEETAYEDFGLCAYVALPHMYPSQNSGIYNRYVKLHQAFKNVPQFEIETRRGPDEVNVLYWNLKRSAFSANAHNIFDLPDGFYVRNYDYSRGKTTLDRFQGLDASSGPFLVVARGQLRNLNGMNTPNQKELVVIDLSRVHEDAFDGVVGSFFHRVLKNPHTWKGNFEVDRIQAAISGPKSGQKPSVYLATWNGSAYVIQK